MSLWNPLNPASPLRSGRVQGAALILAAALLPMVGVPITEVQIAAVGESLNLLLTQIGGIVGLVGTIRAASSPRNF